MKSTASIHKSLVRTVTQFCAQGLSIHGSSLAAFPQQALHTLAALWRSNYEKADYSPEPEIIAHRLPAGHAIVAAGESQTDQDNWVGEICRMLDVTRTSQGGPVWPLLSIPYSGKSTASWSIGGTITIVLHTTPSGYVIEKLRFCW
jgi:hypothetical protein